VVLCLVLVVGLVQARDLSAQPPLENLPVPLPEAAGAPPQLYVPDPLDAGGFSGIASGVDIDPSPTWPRWFAGANGLVMTRTLPAGTATMQPVAGLQQLSTTSTGASWPGGVDLHIGRWFGSRQQQAVEFIYWGVYGIGGDATVSSNSNSITAIPQAPGVTVAGTPAANFLQASRAQQISRSDLVNNVEINWLYSLGDRPEFLSPDPAAGSQSMNLMWLAGFRFFELQDVLTQTSLAGSAPAGSTFGVNGGVDQLNLNVATNNNLYGAQVGAKFDWRFMPRMRLAAVPKFLLAGNAITNTSSYTNGASTQGSFASGAPASAHSTLGVFSWLGSIDTSVAFDVTERWSLWVGYRVVGVGNIAQADQQWPGTVTTAGSLTGIDAGSSTIVHGGFAGFEGRY